jgi:hypothetical protein
VENYGLNLLELALLKSDICTALKNIYSGENLRGYQIGEFCKQSGLSPRHNRRELVMKQLAKFGRFKKKVIECREGRVKKYQKKDIPWLSDGSSRLMTDGLLP